MNTKTYEKAVVIFVDILGTKNRSDFTELFNMNKIFHSELLENNNHNRKYLSYARHIYTFSDCAYIIYDYKNKVHKNLGKLFDIALSNCEPIFMKFLAAGILFRGGVTYGNVYYEENNNIFFGDAINKAFELEKNAKYPRILVEEYVAKKVIKYAQKANRRQLKGLKKFFYEHVGCMVLQDTDGKYYMNCFNSLQQGIDYSRIIKITNKQFTEDIVALCDENIKRYAANSNIRSKYEWLQKYIKESSTTIPNKPVVYKKPVLDKILLSKPHINSQISLGINNTGISLDENAVLEMFELYKDTDILTELTNEDIK